MEDLRAAAVDILTLGQYLRPTPNHLDVERFVTPENSPSIVHGHSVSASWNAYPGPLVRSSYRAEQALARNNAGLATGARAARCAQGLE